MDYKNISNFQPHQTHQQPQQPQSISVSEVRTNLIELRNITAEMEIKENEKEIDGMYSGYSEKIKCSAENIIIENNVDNIRVIPQKKSGYVADF